MKVVFFFKKKKKKKNIFYILIFFILTRKAILLKYSNIYLIYIYIYILFEGLVSKKCEENDGILTFGSGYFYRINYK